MVNSSSSQNEFRQPLLHEVVSLLHRPIWRTNVLHMYQSRG